MKIYQINTTGGEPDYVCASDAESAKEVYMSHVCMVDGFLNIKELNDDELKQIYWIDFNESQPDELDEEDEDYDASYNPSEWVNGGKIIETFYDYLQRQNKEHFIYIDEV
jgi:hypothetical protein